MIDQILEKFGIKYEELYADEKEILNSWLESLEKNTISIESIKQYVNSMKDILESEIATSETTGRKDLFAKARLKNYLLLSAFLTGPEKARQQLEKQLSNIKK